MRLDALEIRIKIKRRFHVQSFGHVFQVLIKLYDQKVGLLGDRE